MIILTSCFKHFGAFLLALKERPTCLTHLTEPYLGFLLHSLKTADSCCFTLSLSFQFFDFECYILLKPPQAIICVCVYIHKYIHKYTHTHMYVFVTWNWLTK